MPTALIGLDYIIDIMHPRGKIARAAEQASQRAIISKANEALEIATQKQWLKILVKVGFSPDYIDQPKQSPMFAKVHELGALKLGSEGTDFHPDLNSDGCLTIIKPRINAFYGTNLDAVLRANNIERVILGGVSTAWAVQSTARAAHDLDYQVCILEDLCAAADENEHRTSIELMARIAQIIHLDDLKSF
ncbi:Isochorismatase family protein YecD [Legionella massiliensis]|uniref:Isochorismatase family protein YecD n=1 Tax=Legionella massiliensis TaxID=1034943 RepID=A0A078KTD4_9GAMM|nr:isochorismatase family cysteine hydrolase [Legionella massiliensis]CDZ77740.1 Isochorismatase family protein YecD [Legionella massiliensis]CEE13478.1 Isochorismatase family protein YecD [Legionella massiliensis]